PIRAFFCNRINAPTMAALADSRIFPRTTYRTLGSENEKKSMKLSIVPFWSVLPTWESPFCHYLAYLRQQVEPSAVGLLNHLICEYLIGRAGCDQAHVD